MGLKIYKDIQLTEKVDESLDKLGVELVNEQQGHISITNDEASHVSLLPFKASNHKVPFSHFNEKILDYPFGEKLFESFLSQEFGKHPETFFRGIVIKNSSLKVLDRASYGLYCDYICSEASELNFSTRPLRRFLTDFFMIIDLFSYSDETYLPLSVNYGKGKKTFYCQFTCKVSEEFRYDFFIKNLKDLLPNLNALEVNIGPDGNTLLVRSYWFKDFTKEDWPSLFVSKSLLEQQNGDFNKDDLVATHHAPSIKERIAAVENIPHEDSIEKKQWRLMRKVLTACVNLREDYHANEKGFPDILSQELLDDFIKETDVVESYNSLEESEVEIIIECLNELNSHDEFQRIFYDEMIDIDPKELMENIQEKIEKSDLSKVLQDPENIVVKGTKEEKEEITVIKGSAQKVDNSIWKVKQQKVVDGLKDEYSKLDNPLPKQVEEVLTDTLRKELSGNDEKLDEFVAEIVDAISEELLPESIPNSKFVNRSMGHLKAHVARTPGKSIEVPTLELKLMLSFTDKLIRKGKNYENNLKKESDKNKYLKDQVTSVASSRNSEDLANAIDKNKELRAKVLKLERELELSKQQNVPTKSRDGGLLEDMQRIVDGLNEDIKKAKSESLDHKRQLKINENEMIKLKTQLARHMKSSGEKGAKASTDGDGQSSTRVKQLEKLNQQFQDTAQKMEKEVSKKKSELHGARLEAKTLGNKVKALEKKLELLNRKRAS